MKTNIKKIAESIIRFVLSMLIGTAGSCVAFKIMSEVYYNTKILDDLMDIADGIIVWAMIAIVGIIVYQVAYSVTGTYKIVNTKKYEIKEPYQMEFED